MNLKQHLKLVLVAFNGTIDIVKPACDCILWYYQLFGESLKHFLNNEYVLELLYFVEKNLKNRIHNN